MENLSNDREYVMMIVKSGGHQLRHASIQHRADRGVVLAAVAVNGLALQDTSNELRNDREVGVAAVSQHGGALEHASMELRKDREVALAAAAHSGWYLRHVSEELRGNREVVLASVANDAQALAWASKRFHGDREVVLAAIARNGGALEYASQELRDDRDFVLAAIAAVAESGSTRQFASTEEEGTASPSGEGSSVTVGFRKGMHVEVLSVSENRWLAATVSEVAARHSLINGCNVPAGAVCVRYVWSTKAKWVAPHRTDSHLREPQNHDFELLLFASKDLRNDREVVLAAVATHGIALQYASNDLRGDREIALTALNAGGMPVLRLLKHPLSVDDPELLAAAQPLLVTLHATPCGDGTGLDIACTVMSGAEVALVRVQTPERETLASLRARVAVQIHVPPPQLWLMLPSGKKLAAESSAMGPQLRAE